MREEVIDPSADLTELGRVLLGMRTIVRAYGMNPAEIAKDIEKILDGRMWEKEGLRLERVLFDSEPNGAGLPRRALMDLLDTDHYRSLKARLEEALVDDVGALKSGGQRPGAGRPKAGIQGNNVTLNNTQQSVTKAKVRGNSREYRLRRLKAKAPTVYKQVVSGELSTNKGMIEAGLDHPKIQVRVDTPEAALRPLLKRFSWDDLSDALDGLKLED